MLSFLIRHKPFKKMFVNTCLESNIWYFYTPVSYSPDFTMGSNESKIRAIIIALVP